MYASTLFFTFSVKLSRGFFWHAFNFYLQRASSHTSLHREKTFPSSSPQPWFLLYSLLQRLPNAAIVCWAPGCCSATHPEEKGDKPRHPQSSRIILVPPAPRKNSHPLPLPDGMGLGVSQHRHCMSYMWCFSFLEKKNIKVAPCTFRKPCRSSVLYTSKTSMVPALALLTMGVKGQLQGEKNGQVSQERKCR